MPIDSATIISGTTTPADAHLKPTPAARQQPAFFLRPLQTAFECKTPFTGPPAAPIPRSSGIAGFRITYQGFIDATTMGQRCTDAASTMR
jgi:hypothetical protein